MIMKKAQAVYCPKHPTEQIKQLVISQKHAMVDRVQCWNCQISSKQIIQIDRVDELVSELKNICDPTLSQNLLNLRSMFDSQFKLLSEELQLIKTQFLNEYNQIKNTLEGRQTLFDFQNKNYEINIQGFRNLAVELSKQIELQEEDKVQFKSIDKEQWTSIKDKISQLEIAWKQTKQKQKQKQIQEREIQIPIGNQIVNYSLLHTNYIPNQYGINAFSFSQTQNQFVCSNQTDKDNLVCCEIKETKIIRRQLLANELGYVSYIKYFNQYEEFITCHGKNGVGFWDIQQGFWKFQCKIYIGNEYILIADITQKNDLIVLGCKGGEIILLTQTIFGERKVWHVNQTLKPFNSPVFKLIFNINGNSMAVSNQEVVHIFYIKHTGYFKVNQEIRGHTERLKQIQFSFDSSSLLTSGCDKTIRIYRQQLKNRFYITINILKFSYIPSFVLNSTSMIMITGGKVINNNDQETGILHIWKLKENDLWNNTQMIQLNKTVYDIYISPDDQYIAVNHIIDCISLLKNTSTIFE